MILNFVSEIPIDLCLMDCEAVPFFKLPEFAYGVSARKQKVNLKWNLELDTREWGIKDALVTVPDQEAIFHIEYDADAESEQEKEVTVHLTDIQTSFNSTDLRNSFSLSLLSISLDAVIDGVLKSTAEVGVG